MAEPSASSYKETELEFDKKWIKEFRGITFKATQFVFQKSSADKSTSMASNYDSPGEDYEEMAPTQGAGKVSLSPVSKSNSVVPSKPFRSSKATTKIDNVKSPKIGPKPKKKSSIEELKLRAKDKLRRFKSISESGGTTGELHMYVPEEATQYIEIDDEKGEFTVREFANQFSEKLPMQVYVSKGIYGMEDKYSLSTDDVCNIHFVRQREMVQIEEKDHLLELSVPLNSSIKFGVIYNPQNNENEAMKGYLFPSVSDLLSLGYCSLPKIVCACQFHDPERPGSEPGREIMAIKEVILPDNPDEFRKLRVFSISALRERLLDENVYGHFSTRPSFMQLYLPEILRHVSSPIPCEVSMFRNPLRNEAPGVPSSLFRKIIYLRRQFMSTTLIATSMLDQTSVEVAVPFEIPTDIDVEFQVIKLPEEKMRQLKKDTEYLAENMDESKVKRYRYTNVSDEVHRLQSSIYLAVRGHNQCEDDPDYIHPITGNRLSLEKRVDLAEKGLKKVNISIENLKLSVDRHDEQNDYTKSWFRAIEEKITRELKQVKQDVTALRLEIKEMSAIRQATSVIASKEDDCGTPTDTEELMPSLQTQSEVLKNKRLLASMNAEQVASLLKSIGLDAYVELFKAECISGDILQEVDDNLLDKELGITSKLHRIKMRRLINGRFPHNTYIPENL